MFDTGKQSYKTDIELGARYLDAQTGIEGVATAISFFQHACERVTLELVVQGKIEEYVFDAPRLTDVKTRKVAAVTRTGGPQRPPGQRGSNAR